MVDSRTIEVGAGILDAANVTDRTHRIYEITDHGRFVETTYQLRDPERIERDKAEGGDGTFSILRFELPVRQLWPERGAGEERNLEFNLSKAQADAVYEGKKPSMHVGSPVGRLTKQFDDNDLAGPDSEDVVGEVLVVAEYTRDRNGRPERRYDVVAHIGDRTNADIEQGAAIAQAEAAGSKTVVGSGRASY